MSLAKFSEVKAFFESWGLFPSTEDTGNLNKEAIDQGINRCCYEKCLKEASAIIRSARYGSYFLPFATKSFSAGDDMFFMDCETWAELEDKWYNYTANLIHNG